MPYPRSMNNNNGQNTRMIIKEHGYKKFAEQVKPNKNVFVAGQDSIGFYS
jgi:hypothetical protein